MHWLWVSIEPRGVYELGVLTGMHTDFELLIVSSQGGVYELGVLTGSQAFISTIIAEMHDCYLINLLPSAGDKDKSPKPEMFIVPLWLQENVLKMYPSLITHKKVQPPDS